MTTAAATSEREVLRDRIEARMMALAREIRSYPGPIAGCDAQFNYLLDLRAALTAELTRLDRTADDDTFTVERFIATSKCAEMLRELAGH